jgi:hypothetical protein
MTTETLSITHVRILIDADARIAFVSVREFDDSYPDHPWTDADSTYTDAEYNGDAWLDHARAIAADYAEQWGVRTIVEAHA